MDHKRETGTWAIMGRSFPLNIKNGSVATSRSNHLKVFILRNIEHLSAILFDTIDSLVLGLYPSDETGEFFWLRTIAAYV
jgi:hypothetical protein